MPTYEYICRVCNIEYSKYRHITQSDPGYKCDKCFVELSRKYLVNNIFSGSGFYSTDKRLDKNK